MVIFDSYVSLPEGIDWDVDTLDLRGTVCKSQPRNVGYSNPEKDRIEQ